MTEAARSYLLEMGEALGKLKAAVRSLGIGKVVQIEESLSIPGIIVTADGQEKPYFLSTTHKSPLAVVEDGKQLLTQLAEPNPLERYRIYYDLTYAQLGERLGFSSQLTFQYCRNVNSPSQPRREQIAKATKDMVPKDAAWPLEPRGKGGRPLGSKNKKPKSKPAAE